MPVAAPSELYYRSLRIERAAPTADGLIEVIASTDEPCDVGPYRESLSHAPGAIEHSSARTVLFNHDRNQPVGGIESLTFANGRCLAKLRISPDAKASTGVGILELVRSGALAGISVGYQYADDAVSYDDSTRTIFVSRWQLREISLTPTQADTSCQVTGRARSLPQKSKEPVMPEAAAPAPTQTEAEKVAIARAERAERESRTRALADSHGLSCEGLDFAKGELELRDELMKRMAAKVAAPAHAVVPQVTILAEESDKLADAASDAIVERAFAGVKLPDSVKVRTDNPFRGRGLRDMARVWLNRHRFSGAEELSNYQLSMLALGKGRHIGLRAANVVADDFASFVTLNAINKSVAVGWDLSGSSIRYQPLVRTERKNDFKTFTVGALSMGNLQKTVEGEAFPELVKSEGAYSSSLKMWGGTLNLTMQALLSDDTSQFMANLRQAGVNAQKTIDKRVFQKLLMGTSSSEGTSTWTSNTTSGSLTQTSDSQVVVARNNLGTVRAAFANKVGLDGNPLGHAPRFLICGPTAELAAKAVIGFAPGSNQATQNLFPGMEVVSSHWLELSSLTGYSTTSYYLLADPNEVAGLILSFLEGMDVPQTMEYDAGAVAARSWKVFLPFEADLAYAAVSGTNTVFGAHQGT
jgi:HK97 family phage prohead protease